jgi:hypothetical protein
MIILGLDRYCCRRVSANRKSVERPGAKPACQVGSAHFVDTVFEEMIRLEEQWEVNMMIAKKTGSDLQVCCVLPIKHAVYQNQDKR